MNIALGFGSTETAFETEENHAIRLYIENRYSELAIDYFTDDFIKDVSAWIGARGKVLQTKGEEYKVAAEYPVRYSYYWPYVVADVNHIVVILSVHHINRRHALSPDGWAVLCTKPVWLFENLDMPRRAGESSQQ